MSEYRESTTLTRMYWEDGFSTYQIAEHFGVSDGTVRYWMDAHGIDRRDYRDAAANRFLETDALHTVPVHVDNREPSTLIDIIDDRTDFSAETRHLRTGDLVFPTYSAAIERKRFGDAVGSISNGRLWSQLERLDDEFDHAAVVVTGQYLHPIKAQCHNGEPASVRSVLGTIAHINENYDSVHAVWLPGDDEWGYVQLVEYADRWLGQLA